MICTECKATIADKAIVCYRCGAPTAMPAVEKRTAEVRSSLPRVVIVLELLAAVFVVAFFQSEPGTAARTAFAVAAGTLFATSAGVFIRSILSRRRGPKV